MDIWNKLGKRGCEINRLLHLNPQQQYGENIRADAHDPEAAASPILL